VKRKKKPRVTRGGRLYPGRRQSSQEGRAGKKKMWPWKGPAKNRGGEGFFWETGGKVGEGGVLAGVTSTGMSQIELSKKGDPILGRMERKRSCKGEGA